MHKYYIGFDAFFAFGLMGDEIAVFLKACRIAFDCLTYVLLNFSTSQLLGCIYGGLVLGVISIRL